MTSRHCTHTQTGRKSDMPGRVFLPWALAFTAIYVYTYILFVSSDNNISIFSLLTVMAYILCSYNLLLLARCQHCSWWRHRQCIDCCWPSDVIVTMTSRHCAHTQTERYTKIQTCLDVSFYHGHCIHCNIRGVSTDWCTILFRLATSVFVFLFQVFKMASLVGIQQAIISPQNHFCCFRVLTHILTHSFVNCESRLWECLGLDSLCKFLLNVI